MVETVEKRYLILVSRSPTAPKRYTALAPTRADRVSTMGPLGKLILRKQLISESETGTGGERRVVAWQCPEAHGTRS